MHSLFKQGWQALWLGCSLLLALLPGSAAAHPLQQNSEPVYGLFGTLGKATNYAVETYLLTNDNKIYAVVGETPEIEAQIVQLREQGATVKVWGTLYPQGRTTATPEIVASSVQASEVSQPTPAPVPTQPQLTVTADVINVRSGPGTDYPTLNSLDRDQTCTINGRNQDSSWWQVSCPNGVIGWVFGTLVSATGDTASLPVVNVPPPPPPPVPPPPTVFYGWRASYFGNRDLAGPSTAVADVAEVNFDWGGGSPAGVPGDNFSTRFERTINFNPGTYRFSARADDGVRVFVDNQPIIDQWHVASGNIEYTADRSMYGNQTVRVEHYEEGGMANLHFTFVPLANTTIDGGGNGEWAATYYNNPDLSGNPALVRREPRAPYPLDLDWGNGSPAPGIINEDNFSTRWVGSYYFDAGDYMFQVRSDDGVRVYIDGIRVIDGWSDGYKEPSNQFLRLGGGNHQMTVEYYERGGAAFNRVWWWRMSGGGSSGGGGNNNGGGGRDQ